MHHYTQGPFYHIHQPPQMNPNHIVININTLFLNPPPPTHYMYATDSNIHSTEFSDLVTLQDAHLSPTMNNRIESVLNDPPVVISLVKRVSNEFRK